MSADSLIWLLVYLCIIVIVVVVAKRLLEYMGLVIPQIVWIVLGAIVAIVLLLKVVPMIMAI